MNLPTNIAATLLYLDGVSVSFDGFRAINNLSLTLDVGEMRAIIGPNGAGKTTMMDIITGKTRADEGDVFFDHGRVDLSAHDEADIATLGIGRKFQKPTVFESHSVEDNILLAMKGKRSAFSSLFPPLLGRGSQGDHQHSGNRAACRETQRPCRQSVSRPETMARDRHAAGPGPEAPARR